MRLRAFLTWVACIWVGSAPLNAHSDEGDETIRIADAQVTLIGEVRLPAQEAGAMSDLRVREGDIVEAGTVLAGIEADLAQLQELAARSDYDIAKKLSENDIDERFAHKSHEVSDAELRRATESVRAAPKSISKTELERLQLVVDRASLTAEQARRDREVAALTAQTKKALWEAAQRHVERCRIVAPWKGMIVQVLCRPGEWINPGDPVLRLIQLDRLRVEAFVDGRSYNHELSGCPVKLTVLAGKESRIVYSGRIVFVSPEMQPVTRQVRIWAEVENPQLTLRPGERGELSIEIPKVLPSTQKPTAKSVTK